MLDMKGAHNVEFSGITFENSMGLAVNMDINCKNVAFKGCTFKNLNAGLYMDGYDNLVSGCDFYNIMNRPVTLYGGDCVTLTKGNNTVMHDTTKGETEINRGVFNGEKKEYWQARATGGE